MKLLAFLTLSFGLAHAGPVHFHMKDLNEDLTTREIRFQNKVWSKAGLAPYTKNWDHERRESLLEDLEEDSLAEVQAKYPAIPAPKIKAALEAMHD